VFNHILLPTDGSALAEAAADAAIEFARQTGARLTAVHVMPELHLFTYEPGVTEAVHDQVRKDRELHSRKVLDEVKERAQVAGVLCDTLLLTSDYPDEAIISAARAHQCDLIAMASHGRKGIAALLLGSVTQKVLTHSAIPVLVFR
jgi:nucleotide-binding universal stress UspA family protein